MAGAPALACRRDAVAKLRFRLLAALAAAALSGLAPARAAPAGSDPDTAVAMAAVPARWSAGTELSGAGYRWSLYRGSLDIGLGFEGTRPLVRPIDDGFDSAAPFVARLPSIHVGLRGSRPGAVLPASSLLERSLGLRGEAPTTRVGIEWKPAESQISFLRQGLGIRLDDDQRLVMRLRKGWIGVYLRSSF